MSDTDDDELPPQLSGGANKQVGGSVGLQKKKQPGVPGKKVPVKTKKTKSIVNFCQNIKPDDDTPDDVKKVLALAKQKNNAYEQCQGTTTMFGTKNCYHRQCYCITKNDGVEHLPSDSIFSKSEIKTLEEKGLLNKKYKICHRHSPVLRIPFQYLQVLNLEALTMEEQILTGIIKIRKISRSEPNGSEVDKLMDEIATLIPYLIRLTRQEAADARASLKRSIDEIMDTEVDERPKQKRKLQGIVGDLYTLLNGIPNSKDTVFQVEEDNDGDIGM